MVRTKEKKAKGDSAFTKQKQKVGRKKLAPATATRAEVHARTLRLATSTAMSAAMTAPQVAADPAQHPPSSATTTSGQKASEDKRKRPVIAVQNFAELLSGTHHYKGANRASAFATLTRVLHLQKEKDEAAAAAAGLGGSPAGSAPSAFDAYMRHAAAESAAAGGTSSSSGASAGLTGLTALEKLKAFAAALEAVTDTDDDVRRGALQSLEVLVDFQWISPDREGSSAPAAPSSSSSTPSAPSTTQDAAELERCNALLMDVQAGHTQEAERVLMQSSSSLSSASTGAASTVSVDRVQAILQSVHVALTHALKPVRLSGVELLALLLRVAPPALVRAAARAVCRHQTSYYYSSSSAVAAVGGGGGLTMAGVQSTNARRPTKDAPSPAAAAGATAALEAAQSRSASLVVEEEKWMLTLIRRVSTLVLRTKHLAVLPALLNVFLGYGGDATSAAGVEAVAAALLGGCVDAHCAPSAEDSGASGSSSVSAGDGRLVWHHPELVNSFFDDIAPQWANYWKELMELRLELLRQEEKLTMASALARSFATVLVFLKRQQQQLVGEHGKNSKVNFFSRNRMYYIKALFIEKMPVTMHELLMPAGSSTTLSGSAAATTAAASSRSMKARLELGLALVMVCVPLAGTDEGWQLMRDYLSIVFSAPRTAAPPPASGDNTSAAAPSAATTPFRFPSLSLLEMSVQLYEQVLRLYPCVAAHIHLEDDVATAASSSDAAAAVWGVAGSAASTTAASAGRHARRGHRAYSVEGSASAQQQQQHSTVAIRLLSFFPALMQTVVRHVVPRTESTGGSAAGSEDAALVRTLLCTTKILERLAVFPDDLLRGRKGPTGHRDGSSPHGKSMMDGSAAAKKLEEGFGCVTRLFFTLREQTSATRAPPAVKRPRSDPITESADTDNVSTADAATTSPPPPPPSTSPSTAESRLGVLLSYPGIVDALLRRFLRVLWFLSSSGHPLLRSVNGTATGVSDAPFAQLLKRSLVVLFGQPVVGAPGLLRCCATPTILLAHSTVFYLGGGSDAASLPARSASHPGKAEEEEPQASDVAALQWGDVAQALRVIQA